MRNESPVITVSFTDGSCCSAIADESVQGSKDVRNFHVADIDDLAAPIATNESTWVPAFDLPWPAHLSSGQRDFSEHDRGSIHPSKVSRLLELDDSRTSSREILDAVVPHFERVHISHAEIMNRIILMEDKVTMNKNSLGARTRTSQRSVDFLDCKHMKSAGSALSKTASTLSQGQTSSATKSPKNNSSMDGIVIKHATIDSSENMTIVSQKTNSAVFGECASNGHRRSGSSYALSYPLPYSSSVHNYEANFKPQASVQSACSTGSTPTMRSSNRTTDKLHNVFMQHSERYHKKRSSFTRKAWNFLENRTSSKWAYAYGSYFVPLFIFCSVLLSFTQTMDELTMPEGVFLGIQMGCEILFLTELLIRFVACPHRMGFWRLTFNQIDVISVLPLFVRPWVLFSESEPTVIRNVIALAPVIRLLKLLRRFQKLHILLNAFRTSVEALPVLVFSLSMIALLFSCMIYIVEPRTDIPNLPKALWFVIVTMTTVGYGDTIPQTVAGELIAGILMVLSALYMAMPIGIVGHAFSQAWCDRDRLLLVGVLQEYFEINGTSIELIHDMFRIFVDADDPDQIPFEDLELSMDEFSKMLHGMQLGLSPERIALLFQALDADNDNCISCEEFTSQLFPMYKTRRLGKYRTKKGPATNESSTPSAGFDAFLSMTS